MLDRPLTRRLVTIPVVLVSCVLVTVTLPVTLPLAASVDLVGALIGREEAMASRLLVFLWLYLVGEVWALIALGGVALTGKARSKDLTYRLQSAWASWNFNSMSHIFRLRFAVEGADQVGPGPVLILSRHTSIVDTLLPARYGARGHALRLRYVVKKELLADPAIDIAGNRLPNHFVDRSSGESDELAAIRALGADLTRTEGVVIFPEGTRFSAEKRDRYVARTVRQGGPVGRLAAGYRAVLPPRPAGTLALLDATAGDVVVLAHRGLEGFARVKDIWAGGLVGSRIDVSFWRVPRPEIPVGRGERHEWLYQLWADVDAWVVDRSYAR